MAVITTLFNKVQQMISTYVLSGNGNLRIFNIHYMYLMPIMYLGMLGCAVLLGYFLWKQYRSEIQRSRNQSNVLTSPSQLPPYTWLNRLVNWTFMTGSLGTQPECIQRWIEDLNISLVNQKTTINVLLYDVCDDSYPPRIKDIGIVINRSDGVIEIPVLFESSKFGFQVSVQEHFDGKVVASSYMASIVRGIYMVNVCLKRQNDDVIANFIPDLNHHGNELQIKLKCTSKQKIVSTIPETVTNMVKQAMLTTPFQLNVTRWGGVFQAKENYETPNYDPEEPSPPINAKAGDEKPIQTEPKQHETQKTTEKRDKPDSVNGKLEHKKKEAKSLVDKIVNHPQQQVDQLKDTPFSTRIRAKSIDKNLQTHIPTAGLSGSLGSLVYVKRTNSGRGPPKPIRVREKQLIIEEISAKLYKKETTDVFMSAELDFPSQKQSTTVRTDMEWRNYNLKFDLASRSMEIKFKLLRKNPENLIGCGIFKLDGVNVHKPGEFGVDLLEEDGQKIGKLIIKISFVENVGDAKQKENDRRSLDLSSLSSLQLAGFKANADEVTKKSSGDMVTNEEISNRTGPASVLQKQEVTENAEKNSAETEKPAESNVVYVLVTEETSMAAKDELTLNAGVNLDDRPPLSPRERALTDVSKSASKVPMRKRNKDWPKVHRSRSLIFGKGKKKDEHSHSALDLHKYEDEEMGNDDQLEVPENSLQKNASIKKKKSRSVSKLVSKIARKTSMKKNKEHTQDDQDYIQPNRNADANNSNINGSFSVQSSPKSDISSLSSSFNESDASLTLSPGGNSIKRSKSLRQRLFGAKRKNVKN